MAMPRRSVLTMLGLAPAVAGAVSVEAFEAATPPARTARATKNGFAAALRRMADEIEAERVMLMALRTSTTAEPNELVRHRLEIDFLFGDDPTG